MVKIKVKESGMHLVTADQLRRWGFQRPERVRVYGYGGNPQSNILSEAQYADDLPLAPCEYIDRGLVFYAHGPQSWELKDKTFVPSHNYYSTEAFYFLGEQAEGEDSAAGMTQTASATLSEPSVTTFTERRLHESELISVGATGHMLLGEDFRSRPSQTFSFALPGNAGNKANIRTVFAANIYDGKGSVKYTVNGAELTPTGSVVDASAKEEARHYMLGTSTATVDLGDNPTKLDLTLGFTATGTTRMARLDNITVTYSRALALDWEQLQFSVDRPFTLTANGTTRIWDVTSPGKPLSVNSLKQDGTLSVTPTLSGLREYVAWNAGATFATPALAGEAPQQDLHGTPTPDMVIFTLPQWKAQAEELAALHRAAPQSLRVLVVNAETVYNEFSSGTPDFGAFRRMLKMLWDRGADAEGHRLQYALMFGRSFYDHRAITAEGRPYAGSILPQWQSVNGDTDNTSFTTEDYLAFLHDDSGKTPGNDYHCIGVGRIPVSSGSDAVAIVKKIKDYMADSRKSDWKNRYVLCADDGDQGEHLKQMDDCADTLMVSGRGGDNIYHKVYVDAFNLIDKKTPAAHERMNRLLNQGAAWWWYIGHAAATSWTGEGLLTLEDINVARFPHAPMLYAATCNFLRWDRLQMSGAEMLYFNPYGIIGAIAATRPVYITNNISMSVGIAKCANLRDSQGRALPIGEVFRRAKNTSLINDTNKLRYVLMGDPALTIAVPHGGCVLDSIDSTPIDPANPPTFMAQQRLTVSGRVLDGEGNVDTSFNGYVTPVLYDAEYSTVSQGHTEYKDDGSVVDGTKEAFDEIGERIFVGRAPVKAGEFSVKVAMPMEISGNYRPATLNLYAVSDDNTRDAVGISRKLYVYGYANDVERDTVAPVIEYFGLNGDKFRSGQTVNATPMVMARMRDDIGINISSAGIGHQVSLQLDGARTYPEAVHYYAPGNDGATSGTLNFLMPELSAGPHSLRLRVWDTSSNMSEQQIDFIVDPSQRPEIVNLYATHSPASELTNFIVSHNRPDMVMSMKVEVFDLNGRPVWSGEQKGRSDMELSQPMTWYLTDRAGRRVPRGIYVYRATVSTDSEQFVSASRKLAVTAQ